MRRLLLVFFVLCLSVSVFAVENVGIGFTPSVSAKSAPEIVTEINGSKVKDIKKDAVIEVPKSLDSFVPASGLKSEKDAIILVSEKKGEEGKIVGAVKKIEVDICSYAEKSILEIKHLEKISKAYEELRKVDEYTDVVPDLEQYLIDEYSGDLAATQIFYVYPKKGVYDFIDAHELLNLRLIFKQNLLLGSSVPIIIVKNSVTEEWSTIDPKTVLYDWYEKGTFSVDFHFFGTVVFLEPKVKI